MKNKEARLASPLVVLVEAASTLIFHRCMIAIFFLTQGPFCKILVCNLSKYCICSPYCRYTCDLNIMGTRIEASVLPSRNWGMIGSLLTMVVLCALF
jgi:hypothetical protein